MQSCQMKKIPGARKCSRISQIQPELNLPKQPEISQNFIANFASKQLIFKSKKSLECAKKFPVDNFTSNLAIFLGILKIDNLAILQLAPQTHKELENRPTVRLSWHVKSIFMKYPEFSQNFLIARKNLLQPDGAPICQNQQILAIKSPIWQLCLFIKLKVPRGGPIP